MANISKITLPNGQTYDIKDDLARGIVVNIATGSSSPVCDTSIEVIHNAIINGKNVICIFDGSDVYQLWSHNAGSNQIEVVFAQFDGVHLCYLIGTRSGNTDQWTYSSESIASGTNVIYNEWTYN